MSKAKQLQKLEQGVGVWNRWRARHPEIAIDLREANLSYAKLEEANLSCANLSGANLYKVRWIGFFRVEKGMS